MLSVLFTGGAQSQCGYIPAQFPDSICSNEGIQPTLIDSGFASYQWYFGLQTPVIVDAPDNLGNPGNSLSSQTFGLNIIQEGNQWYGFVKKSNARDVYRYDFGTSLLNPPTTTQLSVNTFANDGSISNDDIDLIEVNGNWYGFTPVRDGAGIVRYDFGSSLDGDTVTATNLGNMNGAMNWPRSLKVITYEDSIYLIAGNYVGNSITVYNMGVDPTNATPVWFNNFSTNSSPVVNQVISVMPYVSCGKWIILAGGRSSDNLVRYQFDGSFASAPTASDQIGSGANFLDPYEIGPLYESGRIEFYVRTRSSSCSMTRLVFTDSIDQSAASVVQQTYGDYSFQLVSYALDISIDENGTHVFCINASSDLRRVSTPHTTTTSPHVYNGISTNGLQLDTNGMIRFSLVQKDASGNLLLQNDSLFSRVGPLADWQISGTCEGDSTQVLAINNEAQITQVQWDWDLGNGSSSTDSAYTLLYGDTGFYHVQLSLQANGCTDSLDTNLFIFPQPTAQFTLDTVCQGADVFIANQSTSHPNDQITTSIWTREGVDTLLSFDPTIYFPDSGWNTIALRVETQHGCADTTSLEVYAKPAPIAEFGIDSTCLNALTLFSNYSGSTSTYTSAWDFGDGNGSSQASPSHVYPDTGNYLVTLITTSSNGLTDTAKTDLRISPTPQVGFALDNGPYCQRSEVAVFNTSQSIDSIVSTRLIIGNDTLFGDSPTVVPTGSGTLNGSFTITAGTACSADTSFSLLVYQQPQINFSLSDSCRQSLASLAATATVTDGQSITSLQWDVNDSIVVALDSITTLLHSDSLNVIIQAATANGCVNTLTRHIDVIELPALTLDLTGPFCTEQTFLNNSAIVVDSTDALLTQTWQMIVGNDTFVSNDPEDLTSATAGTGTLSLLVTTEKGCASTAALSVDVFQTPQPSFEQTGNCALQGVFFEGNYDGSNYVFTWSIGPNALGSGPDFQQIFPSGGNYTLTFHVMDASSGCEADTSQEITIIDLPTAIINDDAVCFGNLSEVKASITTDASDSVLSFIWSVEGSRQSIDSILRFTPDENDEVYVHLVLESASGCTIEREQFLPVLSQPDPSFSASTLFGIVPFEAKLKAASAEVDHLWTLNNTSLDSVTTVSPLIGEAGLHIVNLFVSDSNGCTSASSKTIRAYAGSIDLAILDVKEVSGTAGDYQLQARVRNEGQVPIFGFTLSAEFLDGVVLSQPFSDTLEPSEGRLITFPTTLSSQVNAPDFACVTISSLDGLEDQVPENDRYCIPLNGNPWVQVFPVPFHDELTVGVHLNDDEKVFIDVIDLRGGAVISHSMQGERGYQQWQLTFPSLSAGPYILTIETPTRSEQRMIQKL